MATSKPARRGTLRVIRKVIDKRTIGITVTPVKPVKVVKKRTR